MTRSVESFTDRAQARQTRSQKLELMAQTEAESVIAQIAYLAIHQPNTTRVYRPLSRCKSLSPTDPPEKYWELFELDHDPNIQLGDLQDKQLLRRALWNMTRARILDQLFDYRPEPVRLNQPLFSESNHFPNVLLHRVVLPDKVNGVMLEENIMQASKDVWPERAFLKSCYLSDLGKLAA